MIEKKVVKMKCAELIFDWRLYPRFKIAKLDGANLERIRTARKAGITLPPCRAGVDYRITDGFHRVTVEMELSGSDADIMVQLVEYESDVEMLLDSARVNSSGPLPLEPKDRAHVIFTAMKMRASAADIASALGMNQKDIRMFSDRHSVPPTRGSEERTIVSTSVAKMNAERTPTRSDVEDHMPHVSGFPLLGQIGSLTHALQLSNFRPDEKTIAALKTLVAVIEEVVGVTV